jgi:hypothetical protein
VNAAFLLVATAFVTGSDPVQAVPAPVTAAPVVSNGSGCSSCDTGCNTCDSGHKWFGGFRGLLNRSDCGCDPCGGKRLFSGLGSSCGCGGGFSLGLKDRFAGWGHKGCNTCDTCNTCGHEKSCGCGIMESPLSRLGGLFRRHKGCDTCDTCSTCGSNGAIIQGAPAKAAPAPAVKPVPAPAPAPQKMPAPPAKPVTSQLTPTSTLIIE